MTASIAMRCVELMPSSAARSRRVCRLTKLGPPAPARAQSELHDSSRSRCARVPPWFAQGHLRPACPRVPRARLELEAAHRGRPSSAAVQWVRRGLHQVDTYDVVSGGGRQSCVRVWSRPPDRPGLLAALLGHRARAWRREPPAALPYELAAPCDEAPMQSVSARAALHACVAVL